MSLSPVSSDLSSQQLRSLPLPDELIGRILFFADRQTVQALAVVSRKLSSVIIIETNVSKCHELRTFIGRVICRLSGDTSRQQTEALRKLQSSVRTDFPNLLALKKHIFSIKSQIIDILMTLSQEELADLKGVLPPSFCENIFAVAIICSERRPAVTSAEYELTRNMALKEISLAIAAAGGFDRAIEIAATIRDADLSMSVLQNIFHAMVVAGVIDEALEDATSTENEFIRDEMLEEISQALEASRLIDEDLGVATSTPEELLHKQTLQRISQALAAAGWKDMSKY